MKVCKCLFRLHAQTAGRILMKFCTEVGNTLNEPICQHNLIIISTACSWYSINVLYCPLTISSKYPINIYCFLRLMWYLCWQIYNIMIRAGSIHLLRENTQEKLVRYLSICLSYSCSLLMLSNTYFHTRINLVPTSIEYPYIQRVRQAEEQFSITAITLAGYIIDATI